MRKTIAKAVSWRLIGTAEIFAISFWTTGHIATAGNTAGIAAITSFFMYVAHELAWNGSFSRRREASAEQERTIWGAVESELQILQSSAMSDTVLRRETHEHSPRRTLFTEREAHAQTACAMD
jgi:uncharacterized membrane protein